jgi:putative transposase
MRKSKFSETQIVEMLKDAESGMPITDLVRKHGVSKATFFRWRSKYGGASVADVKRLRELEVENAKLKRMYADLALEKRGDQGCPQPKAIRPSAKRQIVEMLMCEHQLSIQRACRVVRLSRTAYHQPSLPASRRDAVVIAALTPPSPAIRAGGSGSSLIACGVEGRSWNHKHVHRVYCALRLNLRRRTTRRIPR